MKCLHKSLDHLFSNWVVFSSGSCKSSLHILNINPLSEMWYLNIFPKSLFWVLLKGCLLSLFLLLVAYPLLDTAPPPVGVRPYWNSCYWVRYMWSQEEENHIIWGERNVKIKMCLSGKLQEMFPWEAQFKKNKGLLNPRIIMMKIRKLTASIILPGKL